MPDYIIYDPTSSPVAGLVTGFRRSFDKGREAELGPNIIESPDLSGVNTAAPMKVLGGVVVNLTQQDRDNIASAHAAADRTALKAAAKNIFLTPSGPQAQAIALGFRTLREMMLSEINALRTQAGLAVRTQAQFNNAFKTTYESLVDAL
jgi:hypothetical protein